MRQNKRLNWLRATAVVVAVVAIVSGVTFAALQSQQNTLTGNTIETATANLQLSTNGTNFVNTTTGFDFNSVIPGGSAVPTAGYALYLRNVGSTSLGLKLAIVSTPSNPGNVDLSKVNVLLTTVGSATPAQSFTLKSLVDAANTGGVSIGSGSLAASATQQYKLQVSMAADAVTGSSAALGNIDFAFSGEALNQ